MNSIERSVPASQRGFRAGTPHRDRLCSIIAEWRTRRRRLGKPDGSVDRTQAEIDRQADGGEGDRQLRPGIVEQGRQQQAER
ncbi:hypothetical protein JOH51_007129 [Rhizobium leguminosarum]|nr:hypothetical protein [Rhizobium leguminosarum]